ncbi:MAG: ATP-binding protein [Candidatus Micrarchaeales archaeon]
MIDELILSIQNLEKLNAPPKMVLETFKRQLEEKGITSELEFEATHDYSKFVETTLEPILEGNLLNSKFNFGEKSSIFSSCMVFPIVVNNRFLASFSLFSKEEISQEEFLKVKFLLSYLKKLLENQELKRKLEELIAYYEAFFEEEKPKLILNEKNEIIKLNKKAKELANEEFFKSSIQKETIEINKKIFQKKEIKVDGSRIVILEDVTNEKNLEKNLELSSNIGCFLILENGKIVEGNGKLLEIEKLKDVDFSSIIKEKEIAKKINELKEGSEAKEIATLLLPNNVEKKISIFAKKEKKTFLFLTPAEIEFSLKKLKKEFEEFIKNSSEPIYAIDQNGIILYMNEEAKAIFGNQVGNDVKNIYPKNNEKELFYDIQQMLQGGEIKKVETIRITKDGEELLFNKNIVPFFDENGNIEKFYYILESKYLKLKQKELEKEIERKERQIRELRRISELKSNFIYNISHDLKTPLTSIKGFTQLLYNEEFGKLNDEQKEYLKTIISETDRFMELLMRVLEVARIETKKIKLELKETDISELLRSPSIKAFEEVAKKKGLYFNTIISENLPKVICDQSRVIEAVVNLVSNAVKFTQKGGITIKAFRKSKKFIQIEVSDTGIGIKEEDQKKLFKKFYQIERKTFAIQEGSGTGLGLSIAKEIVKLHGGRIGVVSQVGKGSTFWFTLPITGPKERKSTK